MALTFHLDSFDGPLDLLLHLIAKNKINIYDIPIAEILEQYLAVLDEAGTLDMEVSGDFIAMAAQLVYIKSKMLLPVHEEEEAEDPRAQLVEMLLEYQRIREVTPYFRTMGETGRDICTKPPELLTRKATPQYRQKPEDLLKAGHRLLERLHAKLPPPVSAFRGIVGREPVPVSSRIGVILRRFLTTTRVRFLSLFENAASRSEIVATFLAVLELSKTRRVMIDGEGEDVTLYLAEKREG